MAGAPRRRSRSGSAARLLFLALSLWAVAADEGPRLLLLGLRCADRPLDLQPRFSPTHYVYTATLDFSDGGYSIDVLTPKGVEVVDAHRFDVASLLPAGTDRRVVVEARHAASGKSVDYAITVKRLNGTDTAIRQLDAPGGIVSPFFEPSLLSYEVKLPVEMDRLHLRIVPWDSGQAFEVLSFESEQDFEAREDHETTFTPAKPAPGDNAGDGGAGARTSQSTTRSQVTPPSSSAFVAPTTTTTATVTTTTTTRTLTTAGRPSCFDEGIYFGPDPNMLGQVKTIVKSAFECQDRCATTPGCVFFTFWPQDGGCHLQDAASTAGPAKPGVLAGPASCAPPCFARDVYYGPGPNMVGQQKTVEPDVAGCQKRCASTPGCAHFTYWSDGGCHLQDDYATMVAAPVSTLAGPPVCGSSSPPRSLRRLLAGDGVAPMERASTRRLQGGADPEWPSGESQRELVERLFAMEVGQTRLVTIAVRAANGDPALRRTYRLEVLRAPCPRRAPYFARDVEACAVTCSPGFFANAAAGRCEACAPLCQRCVSWEACEACEATRWRALHVVVLRAGRCSALAIPWAQIAEGAAVAICVFAACARCCCSCEPPAAKRGGLLRGLSPSRRRTVGWQRRGGDEERAGPETDRLLGGRLSDGE